MKVILKPVIIFKEYLSWFNYHQALIDGKVKYGSNAETSYNIVDIINNF